MDDTVKPGDRTDTARGEPWPLGKEDERGALEWRLARDKSEKPVHTLPSRIAR